MPKQIEDVIIPERKRSIRNIPIPGTRKKSPVRFNDVQRLATEATEVEASYIPPRRPLPPRSRGSRRTWYAAGAALVVLAFAILSLLSGATLAYVPRSLPLTFANDVYSAQKSGEASLLYSIVKLSGDKGLAVPASGEQDVSRKASGTIIIYNDASAEAQKLVENTRFESPEGKVYRISQAVSIPGKKNDTPGSIEAAVTADAPGAIYNIGLTDFTVPGLKGTPRYSTIYARSKTPMARGFVGKEKAVSADALTKAKSDLKAALAQELLAKVQAEVPPDFILFPSLSSITFEDMPQSRADSSNSVTVNMKGNLYGIMFKKSDLAFALSSKKTDLKAGEPIEIESYGPLEVTFASGTPADLLNLNKIDFKVKGGTRLLWRTDEISLKSDLAGRSKNELPEILKNYPTIQNATATLRPFWRSTFPDEAANITVKAEKPQS